MDRLRDLATRTRRVDCHFRIPKSLSTTSLMLHKPKDLDEEGSDARSTVSSTTASATLAPKTLQPGKLGAAVSSFHSDPTPTSPLPSSDTRPTPAQPRPQEGALHTGEKKTSHINKGKKQPKMKANKDGQASLEGDDPSVADREVDQKLFDQILTNIAQDEVIANSGRELYRRVNECARDYMEAKQIVERREHEIAAISTKIEAMQATMDNASKHLHKAQAIAAEAIDSSIAEQFRLREKDNLTKILIGMDNAIAEENFHSWPREKVNRCLEDLQSVYQKNKHHCQSPMVSSGNVHIAKHFFFHADYDDAFEPMLFHLANQTDYKGFVERSRREDHESATQHHVDYTLRPNSAPKTRTTTTPVGGDEDLTDKAEGSRSDGGAPYEGSDGAAGATQARFHGLKQDPLQKLARLPPRSSSLPSSAYKTSANITHRLDHQHSSTPGDAVFADACEDTAYVCKRFDFKPNADMNELADKIFSKMKPRSALTSDIMNAAVLESMAGLEVILKDGAAGVLPKVRTGVTSVVEHVEQLNKDHIKSEQVARKLSAVAETNGFRSTQTHEVSGGQIRVDVTAAGSFQGGEYKTAKQGGPDDSKARNGNKATHRGEDTTASGRDSDQMWKDHYVSAVAPGKP